MKRFGETFLEMRRRLLIAFSPLNEDVVEAAGGSGKKK